LTCSEGYSIALLHQTAIGRGRGNVLGVGSILKISDPLHAFGKIEEADFDFNIKLELPMNAFVEDYVSPYRDGTLNPHVTLAIFIYWSPASPILDFSSFPSLSLKLSYHEWNINHQLRASFSRPIPCQWKAHPLHNVTVSILL
jgi:hypothetical protein